MPFRRRKPAAWKDRLRQFFWPSKGWIRSIQYFKMRVVRLSASPHAIAAGVAAGILASWTPFIGFHFLIAFALCYLLAGNMVAAAVGTAFGNPLTFPLIWACSWELGKIMLDGRSARYAGTIDLHALFRNLEISQLWTPVLKPMLWGALPLGVISGLVFYALTFYAVSAFQAKRRARLMARRPDHISATTGEAPRA